MNQRVFDRLSTKYVEPQIREEVLRDIQENTGYYKLIANFNTGYLYLNEYLDKHYCPDDFVIMTESVLRDIKDKSELENIIKSYYWAEFVKKVDDALFFVLSYKTPRYLKDYALYVNKAIEFIHEESGLTLPYRLPKNLEKWRQDLKRIGIDKVDSYFEREELSECI